MTRDPRTSAGRSRPYELWTRGELDQLARRVGLRGRSRMSRVRLIEALREGADGPASPGPHHGPHQMGTPEGGSAGARRRR